MMQAQDPSAARTGAQLAECLRQQMRVRFCDVPRELPGSRQLDGHFALAADAFLFETEGGMRFYYELGQGVAAQVPDGAEQSDFELFLWGTVFGAVAWLNGFFALHASAVARGGRVFAFTGDSGAGKSTLAAALAGRGFEHFCDDTLVLAPERDEVVAIPDGKPLKLWDDAFALTAVARKQAIASVPGKFYARTSSSALAPLPLTDLFFLEIADTVRIEPIEGSRKLTMLSQAIYRGFVHAAFSDPASHAGAMIAIASQVRFWTLARPFDPDAFDRDAGAIAAQMALMVDASG